MSQALSSFSAFWPFYCREHSKSLTRRLHFIGSVLGPLATVAVLLVTGSAHAFWLWAVCGYGFAWFGHFFVEENRPATFRHPFYSLAADYVMVWRMLTGTMDGEVARALREPEAALRG